MKTLGGTFRVLKWLLAAPLLAAYGAWTIARVMLGACARSGDAMWLLAATRLCPSCGYGNTLHGRWKCKTCGATYHGVAFSCGLCSAPATWFPCSRCGVSIPLGARS